MLGKGFFLTESHNPDLPPEEWTLVYEKTTPGTDTFNINWGRYKIEASAGGGGGAAALGGQYSNASAGASGGCGSYGEGIVEYGVLDSDMLTINIGSAGSGATRTNGTAPSTNGGNTTLSDTTHGSNFVVLSGGNAGYAHATTNGDSASVGSGGTFTTSLTDNNFHNGTAGKSLSTSRGSKSATNTTNPSPYNSVGYGGGWAYDTFSNTQSASNGGAGFVRIYKSNLKPGQY